MLRSALLACAILTAASTAAPAFANSTVPTIGDRNGMKDSDVYWSTQKLYQVGESVFANFFMSDIAIDDVMQDGVKIYEPSYIEVYVNILSGNAWSVGDYKRESNLLEPSIFPGYDEAPSLAYTPPRVGEGVSGTIGVEVTPPRYVSPFGRSYPIIMTADAVTVGENITHMIDSYIEPPAHIGHFLAFGPMPRGNIQLPKGETYLPGEDIIAEVDTVDKLVNDYGEQCSINLYHAGRVHVGGGREGDWLVDRHQIAAGQNRYDLDSSKALHLGTFGIDHEQTTVLGPHLVELWCWGALNQAGYKITRVELGPRAGKGTAGGLSNTEFFNAPKGADNFLKRHGIDPDDEIEFGHNIYIYVEPI